LLIVSLLLFWPLIYNYHLFSLARLKNSIEVGDSYAEVETKFKDYQKDHLNNGELHVVIDKTKLFIYHVNSFDDCQLTVLFSSEQRVKEITYIGD